MDKNFETHKATLLLHQDNFYLIDFRREDGDPHYSIRFFVDTQKSSVHIEGDLGECISCWYNSNTIEKISEMMLNVPYWTGKFCCSTNKYVYNEEKARQELLDETEWYLNEFGPDSNYYEHIDAIMNTFTYNSGFMFDTTDAREAVDDLFDGYLERSNYGEEISKRVYLWAEAFDLALKQLGLK